MTLALAFPNIDPVLISFGPFAIRWYSLAYIFGLLLAWRYMVWMVKKIPGRFTEDHVGDFLVWATFGVILGGRLGYVLFYKPAFYLANPGEILLVWQGGMSFHGGLLGVIIATAWFCKSRKIEFLRFFDMLAAAAPIGLLLGRIANFINGELYGRPAPHLEWAMVFPHGGAVPRHPSQLYEAALEGLVLLIVLYFMWRSEKIRERPGLVAGAFLIGYGIARSIAELYRMPDQHLGYLFGGTTMGQWLSAPMWIAGFVLIALALRPLRSK